MKKQDIESALGRLGYEILYRQNGWTECLVYGHGESWRGEGPSEEEALQVSVRRMLPSHAARTVLELPDGAARQESASVPVAEAAGQDDGGAQEPETKPEPQAEPEPEPQIETEPKVAPLKPVAVAPTVYVDPRVEGGSLPEPEPDDDKLTREEGLEILSDIENEIEDSSEDFARMTTMYQRLHASEWIFRARAIEEQLRADEAIEEAVHQIARHLTALCKVYWPGSVKGLQAYMTPAQALEGLVRTKKIPTKWEDTVEIVNDELEDLAESPRDPYGWGDLGRCLPAPPDADAVLEEAVAKIEDVLGPLSEEPDRKKSSMSKHQIAESVEELVLAAHLLRWCRQEVSDSERWGRAMGLLRWAARNLRDHGDAGDALRLTLSDEFQPTVSWAALLGRDPEVKRKNRVRRDVMNKLPRAESLEEDIMDWLVNAFTVLTNPQIAKITVPVHGQILQFTDVDFADADRNARSRLRKLQKIIRRGMDTSNVALPEDDEDEDDEGSNEGSAGPTKKKKKKVVDPATLLLERVQEYTAGKRILFVGNRDDTRLKKELEQDLHGEVTIKSVNSKREKVVVDAVTADKFDLVLVASSFVGHNVMNNVCRKAKAEGIPAVRVSKGRRAATVRALARAFNITAQRKQDDGERTAQTA